MQVQKASPSKNAKRKNNRKNTGIFNRGLRKNVGEQTNSNDDAIRWPRFSLLASQLSTVTKFEMLAYFGSNDQQTYEVLNMIDSEEKQLQAISDLYQIVKAQPKYKNLKERVWSADTSPLEVIIWLLRKLGPLAEGKEWTIDTYKEGSKTRYRFVTWLGFHRQAIMDKDIHFKLDFLPFLKGRDLQLHDMIIDAVALISRNNKIPLWDEDGDYSKGLERVNTEPHSATRVNPLYEDYQVGLPAQYLKIINRRKRAKGLEQELRSRLIKYTDSSDRKTEMVNWVQWALGIAKTKQCMEPYSFLPNYIEAASPIGPQRLYKFVWSTHWKDYVHKIADAKLRDDEKFGSFLPVMYTAVYPGKKMIPINDHYKKLAADRGYYRAYHFPERMFGFLNEGWKHFNVRFKSYYYKNAQDETATEAYIRINQPAKSRQRAESKQLLINILHNE